MVRFVYDPVATARGSVLSLKTLLGLANGKENPPERALEEFMVAMESFAEEKVEPLPRNFSREDV